MGIELIQNFDRPFQVLYPIFRKDHVLVRKHDQIIGAALDGIVISFGSGRKPFLNDNLVPVILAEARRSKKISLKYLAVVHRGHKCY